MKFHRLFFVVLAGSVLASCVSVANNYVPQRTPISFPALNQSVTATIGAEMLRQGTATITRGVLLRQSNNIHGYMLSPGFYPQTGEDEEHTFTSFGMRGGSSDMGYITLSGLALTYPVSLRFSKKDRESCVVVAGLYGINQASCDTEYSFEFTEKPIISSDNFQQTLIYSGRVGDRVRISYREFSGDMARAPFSNEAEYDLSTSDIIAYRGARIRVVNANNERIEYVVLSNFNEAQ